MTEIEIHNDDWDIANGDPVIVLPTKTHSGGVIRADPVLLGTGFEGPEHIKDHLAAASNGRATILIHPENTERLKGYDEFLVFSAVANIKL